MTNATQVRNFILQPMEHPVVAPAPHGFRGGLRIEDAGLDQYRHLRSDKPVDSFPEITGNITPLSGEYSYAGILYHHFGHVLSEMVHRILPTLQVTRDPDWLFITFRGNPRKTYADMYQAVKPIYDFLGLRDEKVTIIQAATEVETLNVAKMGSNLGAAPSDQYLQLLDDFTFNRLDHCLFRNVARPEKLYVSRSGLGTSSGLLGEKYLDQAFHEAGFFVFRPEKYSFTEQLDFYRKASDVVFLEGSACHSFELLPPDAVRRCSVLNRREGGSTLLKPVLAPRCRELNLFNHNRYLGSAKFEPNASRPSAEFGVAMLDTRRLEQHIRDQHLAARFRLDRKAYLQAAVADFQDYLEANPKSELTEARQVFLAQLLDAFSAAMREEFWNI